MTQNLPLHSRKKGSESTCNLDVTWGSQAVVSLLTLSCFSFPLQNRQTCWTWKPSSGWRTIYKHGRPRSCASLTTDSSSTQSWLTSFTCTRRGSIITRATTNCLYGTGKINWKTSRKSTKLRNNTETIYRWEGGIYFFVHIWAPRGGIHNLWWAHLFIWLSAVPQFYKFVLWFSIGRKDLF